jgi:hypothetical protein
MSTTKVNIQNNSTSKQPFLFFSSFIDNQSISKFEDSFFTVSKDDIDQQLVRMHRAEGYKESLNPDTGIFTKTYFTKQLTRKLTSESKNSFELLNYHLLDLAAEDKSEKRYLEAQATLISSFLSKAEQLHKHSDIIKPIVSNLVKSFEKLYGATKSAGVNESNLDKVNSGIIPSNSYFGIRANVKRTHLVQLFDFITNEDIELLDDLLIKEEDFINLLTCQTPSEFKEKPIIFNKENGLCAIFLYVLNHTYFNNMGWQTIEDSKLFRSKPTNTKPLGSLIKASSINSAYSKAMKSGKYTWVLEGFKNLIPSEFQQFEK